jgi:hypothetical protein
MAAPPSVSNSDLVRNLGMAGSPSPDLNLAVTQGQGIKVALTGNQAPLDSSQIANRYATTSNSGTSAAAPAAGTNIATLPTLSYAYYRADIIVGFGATAESTANDNFVLKDGATTLATIPVSNIANTMSQVHSLYVNSANGALNLNVGAAGGSAGSIYKGTIRLTRLV